MQAFSFDTVDSTNDAARRLIAEGRLRGRGYVLAREQTAGRGTNGRSWISPKDAGIYLSLVRTEAGLFTPDMRNLTLAAGAACAKALREATGITEIRLKPVNDLLARDRKVGGILTESDIESGRMKSLIVGVGVNVRVADRVLPADAMPPISLEECLGSESVDDALFAGLVERLVANLDGTITQFLSGGAADAGRAWGRYLEPRFSGLEGGS